MPYFIVHPELIKTDMKTSPEDVKANVQASLEKLDTKPDLLLIHTPFVAEKGQIGKLWTILEDLVYDGTLEGVSLGVSNFVPHHLEEVLSVARIKPAAHRMCLSPAYCAILCNTHGGESCAKLWSL